MQTVMPQSDQEWSECVAKGRRLLDDMEKDWPEKGTRDFPSAYSRWYWHLERSSPSMGSEYCYGLEDALEGLGISTREDDWVQIDMKHKKPFPSPPVNEQAYLLDGEVARATGAECIVAINKSDGAVLMLSAQSPRHCARTVRRPKIPNDELPELYRPSDLDWGQWWQLSSSANMEDLKYVITYAVVNTKSTPIMLQALKKWKQNPDAMFGEWDKRATIPMDSEEGAALMGIPTSNGIAFFLQDHQPEIGKKRITKVDMFMHTSAYNRKGPVLIYHIEKVAQRLKGKGKDRIWWGPRTPSGTTTQLDTATSAAVIVSPMISPTDTTTPSTGSSAGSSARSSIAAMATDPSSRNTSLSTLAPPEDEEWSGRDSLMDADTGMD